MLSRKNMLMALAGKLLELGTPLPPCCHLSPQGQQCLILQDTTCPPISPDLWSTLNKSMCAKEEWLCSLVHFMGGGGECAHAHSCTIVYIVLASLGHVLCSRFTSGWSNCGCDCTGCSQGPACSTSAPVSSDSSAWTCTQQDLKPIFRALRIVVSLGHHPVSGDRRSNWENFPKDSIA